MRADVLADGTERGKCRPMPTFPSRHVRSSRCAFFARSGFLFGSAEVPGAEPVERRVRLIFAGFGIL